MITIWLMMVLAGLTALFVFAHDFPAAIAFAAATSLVAGVAGWWIRTRRVVDT